MVWVSHLIRTNLYKEDCQKLFGHVIDHHIAASDAEVLTKQSVLSQTALLWEQEYGHPYLDTRTTLPSLIPQAISEGKSKPNFRRKFLHEKESSDAMNYYYKFGVHPSDVVGWYHDGIASDSKSKKWTNPFRITAKDIIQDSKWLADFDAFMGEYRILWHITKYNGDETNMPFHAALPKSYERFLYLWAKYGQDEQGVCVLPTMALDLVWHAHQIHPLAYEQDCKRLVGLVVPHEPWPDRDTQSHLLEKCQSRTCELWEKEFGLSPNDDHKYI